VIGASKEREDRMENLSARTTQQVVDDHLNLAENRGEEAFGGMLEEDLRRNYSKDIVSS
jgi:hypothetical protein